MKKLLFFSFFASIILSFTHCKNDVPILAPYKETTVVYGLLDQSDSIHYIRVNRGFAGLGNAYTMAQQYDSVNYPVGTITVQLQEFNNGNLDSTIILDTTTAISVSPGIFSYPKQVLYKTRYHLNVNDSYRLVVTNNKTGKVASGTTMLIPDVPAQSPPLFYTTNSMPLNPDTSFPTQVTWYTNAQALIYQLAIRFYYKQVDLINKDTVRDSVDWVFIEHVSPSLVAGYLMNESFTGADFLRFLSASLSAVDANSIKRIAGNFKVMFTSGSQDFYTYVELSQPSLTVNQQKPSFSDVSNAVGIFTSRHTQSVTKPISAIAQEMIDTSRLMKPINMTSH